MFIMREDLAGCLWLPRDLGIKDHSTTFQQELLTMRPRNGVRQFLVARELSSTVFWPFKPPCATSNDAVCWLLVAVLAGHNGRTV